MKNVANIVAELKLELKNFRAAQLTPLINLENITEVLESNTNFTDIILTKCWHACDLQEVTAICLIAVGSYGRRELQPHSDIDLLILQLNSLNKTTDDKLALFIRCLWDIGFEVGSQITNLDDCITLASKDITVISNLIDHRFLQGNSLLYQQLCYYLKPSQIWASNKFFQAKWKEQILRHKKYGNSAYQLEPNVKNSPGGLRDLQMIIWVAQRHYGKQTLSELFSLGFITEHEFHTLMYCRNFLWQIRYLLHCLTGKREDRLSFDSQKSIANILGYEDDANKIALEKFMKHYFNVIKTLRQYNDMLLQSLREAILQTPHVKIVDINADYHIYNRYLEVKHQKIFKQHPEKLLGIFLEFINHPEIKGIRAGTIRLMHHHRHLITSYFRDHPQYNNIFIEILNHPQSVYKILQRMNRYGLLGIYIPVFGKIVGQMQYDLFHTYTVDQHTLFLIRNIVNFYKVENAPAFPLCHSLINKMSNPAPLFIAAIFHDIAKGRGGDHSELGASDVSEFCKIHQLSEENIALSVWLVKHHLLMSQTAQRKDIYNPQTIKAFCHTIPQAYYLDYLYILTVADIRATNPNLWNSWKDSLLKELYTASSQLLEQQQQDVDEQTIIKARQQQALALLTPQDLDLDLILALWRNFKSSYFLYQSANLIALHTKAILQNSTPEQPLILAMPHHTQGGTEFFIYMPYHLNSFAITTTVLSNFRLNILEARISTCHNNYALDSYIVLDAAQQAITNKNLLKQITKVLNRHLLAPDLLPPLRDSRISRQYQHFKIQSKIEFFNDPHINLTSLFLITADRHGLLAKISRAFIENKIQLHNAKIATAGERVEDMFYITDHEGRLLSSEAQDKLSTMIIKLLD